jgi:hypothetical protein
MGAAAEVQFEPLEILQCSGRTNEADGVTIKADQLIHSQFNTSPTPHKYPKFTFS